MLGRFRKGLGSAGLECSVVEMVLGVQAGARASFRRRLEVLGGACTGRQSSCGQVSQNSSTARVGWFRV